ncbi:EAL domain-containing protein [Pseudoalteromonas denitrificans]|uniref:EAL domain-containing protein n=1 Tax=Pseudoalteromonas denitrificans TaxID=43656 RepID=UPI0015A6661D|nr:EAL domain-containing protein [Pseudoalteromonas denitrificans]
MSVDSHINIDHALEYYVGQSSQHSINEILSLKSNQFSPFSTLNIKPELSGFKNPIWFKVKLSNSSHKVEPHIIYLNGSVLAGSQFYLFEEFLNNKSNLLKKGNLLNLETNEILPNIALSVPAKKNAVLYIKLNTQNFSNISFDLYTKSRFQNKQSISYIVWGGFIGILLMMCLYNLVFYRSTRDRTFIYYSIYLLLSLTILSAEQGFMNYVFPNRFIFLIHKNITTFELFNFIFATLFALNFLRVYKRKRFYWKIAIAGNFTVLGLLLINLITYQNYTELILILAKCVFYSTLIFVLVANYNAQYRWVRVFLISWLPILVVGIMTSAPFFYEYWQVSILYNTDLFAVTAEILLISYAFSERYKAKEAKQIYHSTHDVVTGLPNHFVLKKQLEKLQDENVKHTLILVKPTAYTDTRASFGISHANEYITQVAKQLNVQLSGLDLVIIEGNKLSLPVQIARIKDDALAVILYNEIPSDLIEQYAFLINAALEKGVYIDGTYLVGNVDIGIASFPFHANDADELQQRALQALEGASDKGERWCIYQVDENQLVQQKLKLAADLRRALMNNELSLYYQPQIELKNNAIYGCEVLLRWQHPEIGFVPPDDFIPIAESAGLINDVTEWVIEQALIQHKNLLELYPDHKTSINISAQDLIKKDLPVQVISLLTELNIDPTTIIIELTESASISDSLAANQVLDDFKKMGVKIAIDDYGTGYSSLAYLSQLRFNEIKIDKQFVMELEHSKRDQTICKTTIEMAKSLGALVVAEGVENENVAKILRQYGCEIAQGYHFGKPMPFSDYYQWLQRYQATG